MLFTWPSPDFSLPASVSCTAATFLTSFTCTNIGGNKLKVVFTTFSSSPVPSGTTVAFNVNSITNPPSTATTNAFTSIGIFDASDFGVS